MFVYLQINKYIYVIVPNAYPVDLFERIWAVNRLQRLGISRFFEPEIKEYIDYVYRYYYYQYDLYPRKVIT